MRVCACAELSVVSASLTISTFLNIALRLARLLRSKNYMKTVFFAASRETDVDRELPVGFRIIQYRKFLPTHMKKWPKVYEVAD